MKKPQKSVPIGPLSANSATNPHYIEPPLNFYANGPKPDRVCNATASEPLDMRKIWTAPIRPNSDHRHLPSLRWEN